jgi:putative DNA methylase
MEYPKKLIEVALPINDISKAAIREKSMRHGNPAALHLWWARRPLAVARSVLFAQLVNDPGGKRGYGAYKGQTKEKAQNERERLFDIIRDLIKWENLNNKEVIERACVEIKKSWEETCLVTGENPTCLPAFHDPFAGGGAIPLEAQRLGLEANASDLNPVAVLINKAMIEIPPKFAGRKPIGPIPKDEINKTFDLEDWSGAKGLAEDVRRYGIWLRNKAENDIGFLYPKVEITNEMVGERPDLKGLAGQKLTVIAWIWARTVKSPNPAFRNVDVPLVLSFWLSKKKGKEAWIQPVIEGNTYRFRIHVGRGKPSIESTVNRGKGICIMSRSPIDGKYIKSEGNAGRMGQKLMAIVCKGDKGRIYVSPNEEHIKTAFSSTPKWKPSQELIGKSADQMPLYGIKSYGELFTNRQLIALNTFSDLIDDASSKVTQNAIEAGFNDDGIRLDDGGKGATAYGDAIVTYLAFQVDQLANHLSTICAWHVNNEQLKNTFSRQAIAMTWDFAETNPFSSSTGSMKNLQERQIKGIINLPGNLKGHAYQMDAAKQTLSENKIISTDPPYYDNIMYADLSDYFYVWIRKSLKRIYPSLLSTISVPKEEELVASAYRRKNKKDAAVFFMNGMTQALCQLAMHSNKSFPVSIYYAFKQSETKDQGTSSTGWEAFLDAVILSKFTIVGTWPIRTEQIKAIKTGSNVLASSIILVCRKRLEDASSTSRKQFLRELKEYLPDALGDMIGGKEGASPIAPVDLAQSAIGPGMAIFSKYKAVLEADGKPMSVHNALIMINKAIDEYFTEAESDMDADTRFCIDWFQQYGFKDGVFGEADVLARAKGTSVEGVKDAGVIVAKEGKVRLFKVSEYPQDWDPETDKRTPIWEACHHMCRALKISESEAGKLIALMPEKTESIRQLAYRLYTLCERKGWAEDAGIYNSLITSWHAVLEESHKVGHKPIEGTQKPLGI